MMARPSPDQENTETVVIYKATHSLKRVPPKFTKSHNRLYKYQASSIHIHPLPPSVPINHTMIPSAVLRAFTGDANLNLQTLELLPFHPLRSEGYRNWGGTWFPKNVQTLSLLAQEQTEGTHSRMNKVAKDMSTCPSSSSSHHQEEPVVMLPRDNEQFTGYHGLSRSGPQ